ncbi:hypothetical protein ACFQ60_03680 [Streptomyces zhihengii]
MIALLPEPSFSAWALAALLDAGLAEAEAVLDDLVEVHLIQIESADASGIRYQLHDLVRLFGRNGPSWTSPNKIARPHSLDCSVQACTSLTWPRTPSRSTSRASHSWTWPPGSRPRPSPPSCSPIHWPGSPTNADSSST